jgi:hypothetical protein
VVSVAERFLGSGLIGLGGCDENTGLHQAGA